PIIAIPIAAVRKYRVSLSGRIVRDPFRASPIFGVGRVASSFVPGDVREYAEWPRECNAVSWVVVHVFGCDDLIRWVPKLHPIHERPENVVLRIGGHRWSALTKRVEAWSPGAVAHSRRHKQTCELVHVVSAVLPVQTLKVVGRATREDQLIGRAVI